MESKVNTNSFSSKFGDPRQFFGFMLVPQFFIFVSLIVLGSFKPVSVLGWHYLFFDLTLESLTLLLVALAIIFTFYLALLGQTKRFSAYHLTIELSILVAALSIGALYLSLAPIPILFFPVSLCLLTLSFRSVEAPFVLRICQFPLIILGLMTAWAVVFRTNPVEWAVGFLLNIFIFGLVWAYAFFMSAESKVGHNEKSNSVDDELAIQRNILDSEQSLTLFLFQRMSEEFRWRFIPLCVVVSSATLMFGLAQSSVPFEFYVSWAILFFIQAILFYKASSKRSIGELQVLWLISATGLFVWWMNAFVYGVIDFSTSQTGLFLILVGVATVPWRRQFNIALTSVFAIFSSFHVIASDVPLLMFALDGFLIVYAMYRNARHYIRFASTTLLPKFLAIVKSRSTITSLSETLGEALKLVTDSSAVLVASAQGDGFLVGDKLKEPDPVDHQLLLGLISILRAQRSSTGILTISQIGHQFGPALYAWFGYLPHAIFYSRTSTRIGEVREPLYVIVPRSYTIKLVGRLEAEEHISNFVKVIETRSDPRTPSARISQVVVAPQRVQQSREDDLNDIIHLVNNTAQDLSVISDNIRGTVQGLEKMASQEDPKKGLDVLQRQLSNDVEYLEGALRAMSASVSDTKWLREASSMRKSSVVETVSVIPVLEDLLSFTKFRVRRSGANVKTEWAKDLKSQVNVISREFLEASLRAIVRAATRSFGCDDVLLIEARETQDMLTILLSFSGQRYADLDELFSSERNQDNLKAIRNFIDLSRGTLSFNRGVGDHANQVNLVLYKALQQDMKGPASGWILLVDDKPEIVTFYGSVAEALELPYGSATTLDMARGLLDKRGAPLLAVTDIQLEHENGLDLVKDLRARFGNYVPIIVVSGNLDDNLRDRIFAAGATKYLMKPVGRRKLFFEIKQLLDRGLATREQ